MTMKHFLISIGRVASSLHILSIVGLTLLTNIIRKFEKNKPNTWWLVVTNIKSTSNDGDKTRQNDTWKNNK